MAKKNFFDNLMGGQDVDNLFADPEDNTEETEETHEGVESGNEENNTAEVDPETLFEDVEEPESVGSGENKEEREQKDTTHEEGKDTSPETNFYSSIANALAVDGVFPNLDEEVIKVESWESTLIAEATSKRLIRSRSSSTPNAKSLS